MTKEATVEPIEPATHPSASIPEKTETSAETNATQAAPQASISVIC